MKGKVDSGLLREPQGYDSDVGFIARHAGSIARNDLISVDGSSSAHASQRYTRDGTCATS